MPDAAPPLPAVPALTAHELRRLAESAAGLDGVAGVVVRRARAARAAAVTALLADCAEVAAADAAWELLVVEAPAAGDVVVARLPARDGIARPASAAPFALWLMIAHPTAAASPRGAVNDYEDRFYRLDEADETLGHGGFDAFWWRWASIEKFVLPYYLRLVGPCVVDEIARTVRKELAAGRLLGVGHMPRSEWQRVRDPSRVEEAGFYAAHLDALAVVPPRATITPLTGFVATYR